MERLDKLLGATGKWSRKEAKALIKAGRVRVEDRLPKGPEDKVEEGSLVTVDGNPIHLEAEKHYLAYHKPMGEVTTASDPEGRATVMDKFRDYPVRLYPVGRLDYDSEGLLLLTNDGDMMNSLLHPSHEVNKTYLARVSSRLEDESVRRLRQGVTLDGRLTSPAQVRVVRYETFDTVVLVTIHEGRYRQVRRMFEAVGHQVVSLKRVGFGPIALGDLPRGQWRHLTEAEVRRLKEL